MPFTKKEGNYMVGYLAKNLKKCILLINSLKDITNNNCIVSHIMNLHKMKTITQKPKDLLKEKEINIK